MQINDAVSNLRGIRRALARKLTPDGARAVGVNLLDNAVRAYGDPALYSAYCAAVATAMNMSGKTGGRTYTDSEGVERRSPNKYKQRITQDKQRLRDRLKPVTGSYQYHLFNAICGLENLYSRQGYQFGLTLILNHLAEMDQNSISALSDQVSLISHALEAEETRVLMQNSALASILEPVG